MIKPDAMKNGHAGAIIDRIIKEGYRVVALKQTKLSAEKAGEFYAVHKERPFYGELVEFMSSGMSMPLGSPYCESCVMAAIQAFTNKVFTRNCIIAKLLAVIM